MNEQIKELITEATVVEYGVDNGFDRVTFDKEKFAKLIALECSKLCDDIVLKHGYGESARECADKIREHFGAEND